MSLCHRPHTGICIHSASNPSIILGEAVSTSSADGAGGGGGLTFRS